MMKIAVTGATGFLGRYVVRHLLDAGHTVRAWFRSAPRRDTVHGSRSQLEWLPGRLGHRDNARELLTGCDALVHAALDRPGVGFRGAEGDLEQFVTTNVVGSIQLFEAARAQQLQRVILISTCAVHEVILEDRPLDESHPTWAKTHYGAHKAAIEQFIHSYGLGMNLPYCALRPCGIYGLDEPLERSKWFRLVQQVVRGETVTCDRGGKEVHAADVARAVQVLLDAEAIEIAGQVFNCCDRYISEWEVAQYVKQWVGSAGEIRGQQTAARHRIETARLERLGMKFGGDILWRSTVEAMAEQVRDGSGQS